MSTFKSTQRTINADIQTVYDKLSNPGSFSGMAEKAQEELKAQVKDIHFSNDTITLNVNPVGAVELKITERSEPHPFGDCAVAVAFRFDRKSSAGICRYDDSRSRSEDGFESHRQADGG